MVDPGPETSRMRRASVFLSGDRRRTASHAVRQYVARILRGRQRIRGAKRPSGRRRSIRTHLVAPRRSSRTSRTCTTRSAARSAASNAGRHASRRGRGDTPRRDTRMGNPAGMTTTHGDRWTRRRGHNALATAGTSTALIFIRWCTHHASYAEMACIGRTFTTHADPDGRKKEARST